MARTKGPGVLREAFWKEETEGSEGFSWLLKNGWLNQGN